MPSGDGLPRIHVAKIDDAPGFSVWGDKAGREEAIAKLIMNPEGQILVAAHSITDQIIDSRQGKPTPEGAVKAPAIISPPVEMTTLMRIFEESSALRSNVDAYVTNIDGFGHRVEPVLDFDADDIAEVVEDAIRLSAFAPGKSIDAALASEVSAEQVTERIDTLRRRTRLERGILDVFLRSCCPDEGSFTRLRKKTRHDLEVTGNGAWEVIRDASGRIRQFVHVPAQQLLITKVSDPIESETYEHVSPVEIRKVTRKRRFRMYAQRKSGGSTVYFKALGDPRALSTDGHVFESAEKLKAAEKTPANELIHFSIYAMGTPYGLPRWLGATYSVRGSTMSEQVNHAYFTNKGVPPLAITIEGGKEVGRDGIEAMERAVANKIKGIENYHAILIMEAPLVTPSSKPPRMRIQPLTDAQQSDGLFQQYDERNIDKTGTSFRLPRLVRGDSRDFNRATAQSALRLAEDQVFQPERDVFDSMMNTEILPDLGLTLVQFVTQTLTVRDPERLAEMTSSLVRVGVITPGEAREIAGDIYNRRFRTITDPWVERPISLSLAGVQTSQTDPEGDPLVEPMTKGMGGDEGGDQG